MNRIQAKCEASHYCKTPHLTINIDGKALDTILHELYPDKNLLGLVPTLLDSLEDKKEREIVWNRIESNDLQVVPILMCLDDADLWCIIINVEVEKTKNQVLWKRIGIDNSDTHNMPYSIGITVNWLDKVRPMTFEKEEYLQFISTFKAELVI